jgi:hypothetical protein
MFQWSWIHQLPELDLERLPTAWQEAVFALYRAEDKIEPEVVENMRSWPHSGFRVDQSVYLPAGDRAGIERRIGCLTRCLVHQTFPALLTFLVSIPILDPPDARVPAAMRAVAADAGRVAAETRAD